MSVYSQTETDQFSSCILCPRECKANRLSEASGFCKSDASFCISSVCIHKGEEPAISGKKGICNVFFPHCNMQCLYCQNHEISDNSNSDSFSVWSFEKIIGSICETLEHTENIVGFVSPSHFIPQMTAIIRGLHKAGKNPVCVYNSNGYDKVETLRMLEGIIDVYLPDFKYMDSRLAFEYSQAKDYPVIATAAIREMIRQKGIRLILNDRGIAVSGIIIRHLVLPGAADQSIEVLKCIAGELSPEMHISLMSQYYPVPAVSSHRYLNRVLSVAEYKKVVDAFHDLGLCNGWTQDMESHAQFRPDFSDSTPFKI